MLSMRVRVSSTLLSCGRSHVCLIQNARCLASLDRHGSQQIHLGNRSPDVCAAQRFLQRSPRGASPRACLCDDSLSMRQAVIHRRFRRTTQSLTRIMRSSLLDKMQFILPMYPTIWSAESDNLENCTRVYFEICTWCAIVILACRESEQCIHSTCSPVSRNLNTNARFDMLAGWELPAGDVHA